MNFFYKRRKKLIFKICRILTRDIANRMSMRLMEGVYVMSGGPQYETPAGKILLKNHSETKITVKSKIETHRKYDFSNVRSFPKS